ncbi:hypothetical protein ACRBEV_10405 [Methylobacterium phyllosphaerae]
MSNLTNTFAAVVALSLTALAPAGASETASVQTARQGATVPAVISVAYGDPSIATSARDVARQGGFKVAGAVRWLGVSETTAPVAAFAAPAVISVAYGNPRIASTTRDVVRQGGFKVAGATRWLGSSNQAAPVATFTAPGVISVAYSNPSIATSARDVIRQGGLATAGTVRWVPGAPVVAEAEAVTVRVGSLEGDAGPPRHHRARPGRSFPASRPRRTRTSRIHRCAGFWS